LGTVDHETSKVKQDAEQNGQRDSMPWSWGTLRDRQVAKALHTMRHGERDPSVSIVRISILTGRRPGVAIIRAPRAV